MAAPEETKETKKAEKAKAKAVAKGMMRGLREDVEASESEEAIAARKKKRGRGRGGEASRDGRQARFIHWFPYDRVGVVNAVP